MDYKELSRIADSIELKARPTEIKDSDEDEWKRISLAERKNASEKELSQLASDESSVVRQAVAGNPKTPEEVLIKLAVDKDHWVRREAVLNENASQEVLREAASVDDDRLNSIIAKKTSDLAILEKLSNSEGVWTRCYVAENTNTPVEVLEKLSNDSRPGVRRYVAENPKTPSEVLSKLASDPDKGVRVAVEKNPNTPSELLKSLKKSNAISKDSLEWLEKKLDKCRRNGDHKFNWRGHNFTVFVDKDGNWFTTTINVDGDEIWQTQETDIAAMPDVYFDEWVKGASKPFKDEVLKLQNN